MEKKKQPSGIIRPNDLVKVKKVGNEIEVRSLATCNKTPHENVRRLCKGKHVNLKTGEIIENKTTTHRGQTMASLRASNAELAGIVIENVIDTKKTLLLSLTYREAQKDLYKVQSDFNSFFRRIRQKCTQFGSINYISTRELNPDKNGYHLHAILLFNESEKRVFVPAAGIEKLWKRGYISVTQPQYKSEAYNYLTPHKVDRVTAKNEHMHEKAIRQMELPTGQRLFNCSRGVKRPQEYTDTKENALRKIHEKDYNFKAEVIYPNPLKPRNGNTLYHAKEIYKQDTPKSRTRI